MVRDSKIKKITALLGFITVVILTMGLLAGCEKHPPEYKEHPPKKKTKKVAMATKKVEKETSKGVNCTKKGGNFFCTKTFNLEGGAKAYIVFIEKK